MHEGDNKALESYKVHHKEHPWEELNMIGRVGIACCCHIISKYIYIKNNI